LHHQGQSINASAHVHRLNRQPDLPSVYNQSRHFNNSPSHCGETSAGNRNVWPPHPCKYNALVDDIAGLMFTGIIAAWA
jgi:hypothetical protein